MKINKKIIIIFLFIFMFLFNINNVKAEITCTYEMLPVNYHVSDGEYHPLIYGTNISTSAKLIITANDDGITATKVKGMDGSTSKEYKMLKIKYDTDFAKLNKKNKCPKYIDVKMASKLTVDEIDSTKFLSMQDEFTEKRHPMYLVKENNKEITTYAVFSANHALDAWNKIIESYKNETQRSDYNQIVAKAKEYYTQIQKDDALWNAMTTRVTSWTNFSNFALGNDASANDEKLLNEDGVEYTKASRNDCYYYCTDYKCGSVPTGTSKDACVSSCNSSMMATCTNAYKIAEDKCKNIKDTTAKNQCLKSQLEANGVDSEYVDLRTSKMTELQNEIERLKKSVEIKNQNKINIEVGKNPYKVTCDDVKIFHDLWIIIIIIAPVLVIVLGTLDFGRAVISSNEENMKKAWKKFPKRILAVVLLILIPNLISLILSIATDTTAGDTNLMYCIVRGGE